MEEIPVALELYFTFCLNFHEWVGEPKKSEKNHDNKVCQSLVCEFNREFKRREKGESVLNVLLFDG